MEVAYFALPVLALAASWFVFRLRRARFRDAVKAVARRRQGRVVDGFPLAYPWLDVDLEDGKLLVTGWMGNRNGGRAARTVAQVTSPRFSKAEFLIERKPRRVGVLERVGRQDAETGDSEFDDVFWARGPAGELLARREIRRALLAFDARLGVRVRFGSAPVFKDGRVNPRANVARLELSIRSLPPTAEEVERLVDAACALHAVLAAGARRELHRAA